MPLVEASDGGGFPFNAHIGEMDKEVVCQDAGFVGEHPVLGVAKVGVQNTHSSDQGGHFGCGQFHQLGAVDEQLLRGGFESLTGVVAEAVGQWLEQRERGDIGLFLSGVGPTRGERDLDVVTGFFGGLLHGGASCEDDQIRE